MPRKLRELRADLQKAGFRIERQSGSHQVWKHPEVPDVDAVLAGKDSDDVKFYEERQVREALRRLREIHNEEEDR